MATSISCCAPGAVIRQGGDAQERRKLLQKMLLDGFRAAIDKTRKLIKRDQRGAQRQDLDRVGRDGGVDDVDLVAHDQPEHEQHHRHGRTHERAGVILPFTGGEHPGRANTTPVTTASTASTRCRPGSESAPLLSSSQRPPSASHRASRTPPTARARFDAANAAGSESGKLVCG